MHPDLERQRFIEHIEKLREQIDLSDTSPKQDRLRLAEMRARIERLQADNAVLRARLKGRMAEPADKPVREPRREGQPGCRHPNSGLGSLSYEQVVELYERQVDQQQILAMAGVTAPSLSRWRKANGYVMAWVPRTEACGSCSVAAS